MQIVDANIILRYLLNDNASLFKKASDIIENHTLFIPNEIFAEKVYVLEKVYHVDRNQIKEAWVRLLNYQNLHLANKKIIHVALEEYTTSKIDLVDALLIGYNKVEKSEILTFDKKLKKRLTLK